MMRAEIACALIAAAGIGALIAYDPPVHVPAGIAACEAEDTVPTVAPCVWDAATRGNGNGVTFIAYPDGSYTVLG